MNELGGDSKRRKQETHEEERSDRCHTQR